MRGALLSVAVPVFAFAALWSAVRAPEPPPPSAAVSPLTRAEAKRDLAAWFERVSSVHPAGEIWANR